MGKSRLVTIECDGVVETHLPHMDGNYATLCGLDGNDYDEYGVFDNGVNQKTVRTPRGAKVDCEHCYAIWVEAHKFSKDVFDPSITARPT